MSTSLPSSIASDEVVGAGSAAAPDKGRATAAVSRSQVLALRLAHTADASPLKRLAELDEQPDLSGEVLLAWLGSELVAALSVDDGRVIADPFVATSDAISVLELRAHQLVGRAVRPKDSWRRRFVQALGLMRYQQGPERGNSTELEKNYWRSRQNAPARPLTSMR
jgi:hypothetical protein